MTLAHYFIEGQYLGQTELPLSPFPYRSKAFFCLTCGEVWGRVVADGSWDVSFTPCRNHTAVGVQDWAYTPGSILNRPFWSNLTAIPFRANCLDIVPLAVLQYEFGLALEKEAS
jgi:hypothetical protein